MRTLLVALCATLVFAAVAAAGTSTGRAGAAGAADQPILTVSVVGEGTGLVTSGPAGISCGTICSAKYAVGTVVTLTATPDVGSTAYIASAACQRPSGWKGGAMPICRLTLTGDASVQATFNLLPPCVVPRVRGSILYVAKQRLRSGNCRVGTIGHAFSKKVEKRVVISQNPRAGSQREHGTSVNLVVSKGRR